MGPVRQNPIHRTVGLFICVCIALCTIVAHNIAENRPDSFPPYPPDNHHCSDDAYLREGGAIGARVALLWQHNANPSYKLASIPRYDDIVRTAGWAGSVRGRPQNRAPHTGSGRGRPAADGGVLNITAAVWTAGFHWWRPGNKKRTQNVSEYMLVLALCLVHILHKKLSKLLLRYWLVVYVVWGHECCKFVKFTLRVKLGGNFGSSNLAR